jgi:hypothetical protein
MSEAAPDPGPRMSFRAFAATLRPQPVRDRRTGAIVGISAGQPNEIWLKHLGRLHGSEKHMAQEWQALIGEYAGQAAYA